MSRATFPCPRITAVSQLRSGASWRGEVWIGSLVLALVSLSLMAHPHTQKAHPT